MKCIDTGSLVAFSNSNILTLSTSENLFMMQNNLNVPDNTVQHTHSPDDDSERMLMEMLTMWDYSLSQTN